MRDFWDRQDAARRATRWLVVLLLLAVVVIVGLTDLVVAWALGLTRMPPEARERLLIWTTLTTLAVVAGGALWRMWQLRMGGIAVAMELGGREVVRGQTDAAGNRLLDVVEEMAIASGLPVPSVFILDEDGINACAAGHTPADAVVCVTRGALQHLTRDELQGVMAHEFAHILNGDMRLNLRTIGLVHGLLAIHHAGRLLLDTQPRSSSRDRNRGQLVMLGLILAVIGWVGWLASYLIRAAVCRQREALADACGVQFTRNPAGLAGALSKILGLARGSLLVSPAAGEVSHLFFAQSAWGFWDRLVATHPPLEERIRLLDPEWQGAVPDVRSWNPATPVTMPSPGRAALVSPLVGTVPASAVPRAVQMLADLPTGLRQAAYDSQTAQAACLAAILPPGDGAWRHVTDPALATLGRRLAEDLDRAGRVAGRLVLVQTALPALRRLGRSQAEALATQIEVVARADLAAAALAHLVLIHLRPRPATAPRHHALAPLAFDCEALLGALAEAGRGDGDAAFAAAWDELLLPGPRPARPAANGEAPVAALARLAEANGAIKRRLVEACARAVRHDGRVEPEEAELLRLVCDSLGCPLPAGFAGA